MYKHEYTYKFTSMYVHIYPLIGLNTFHDRTLCIYMCLCTCVCVCVCVCVLYGQIIKVTIAKISRLGDMFEKKCSGLTNRIFVDKVDTSQT